MKTYLLTTIIKFIFIFLFFIQSSLIFCQNKSTSEKKDQGIAKESVTEKNETIPNQQTIKTNQEEEWLPRTSTSEINSVQNNEPNTTWMFLKSFVILVFFLLIIYLIFKWVQKRKLSVFNRESDAVIQVLNTTSLTANKSIQLVEIGNHIYILGLGDNISLINRIEDPIEIEDLKNICKMNANNKQPKNFNQIFGSYFDSWSKKDNKTTLKSTFDHFKFFNDRKNKLKTLKNKF